MSTTKTFEEEAVAAATTSLGIITQHTNDGENAVIPLDQMFPHGSQDILFVLWQKIARCLGYRASGNFRKVYEELQDILNYAAFGLVVIRREIEKDSK